MFARAPSANLRRAPVFRPLHKVKPLDAIAAGMGKSSFYVAAIAACGFVAVAADAAPSRFEAAVLAELNRFRDDPDAYADVLRSYRPRFEGKLLIAEEGSEIDIMTN